MKTELVLVFAAALLLMPANLSARTWTEAGSGRTLEGDYVESNETQVVIKSGDRTFKIDIARLSDADKAFIKEQSAKPAAPSSTAGALAKLTPPATLKTEPITGTGDDRKSAIEITNTSDKAIKGFVVDMLFLEADNSVGKSVPHTHSGEDFGKGKTHTIDVNSFFMKDDTAAMGGMVTEVTFADDSTWPPAPADPPAKSGDDPVAAIVLGVIGEGEQAQPVAALHNHDAKDISSVSYRIEYLGADGETLDTTSYGYAGGDDPILPSGKTIVISGGDGPPEGAASARAAATQVKFADETEWKAEK